MVIHFSFAVIILIVGIVTGLLVVALLLFDKANAAANKFLAALVLVSVGSLFHNFLIESGIYDLHQELYFLPVIFSLAVGPLLYLYVNRLINIKRTSKSAVFLHLLPAIIQVIFHGYSFLQNRETKYDIYISIYEPYAKPLQNIAVYLSVAIYLYLSFTEIKIYKSKLNNFYSNDSHLALRWLRKLLFTFMFYYIVLIFFLLLSQSFHFSADYFPSDLIRGVILFSIAIFAVKQNSLLEMHHNMQSIDKAALEAKDLPAPSEIRKLKDELEIKEQVSESLIVLPKEVNHDLLQKIISLVEKEQLYLNEELTINDLATKIGYSSRIISQTINSGLGKTFSRFINEYRVTLFRERRISEQFANLSIMGLAYDCGFNSKSTFNRTYKEITGSLPKEHNLAK